MRTIGIVTLFKNYNYGSVLQCFALQQVLKKIDCDAITLYQSEHGVLWQIKRVVKKITLLVSFARYPDRINNVRKAYQESKRSTRDLSSELMGSFDNFIEKRICFTDISFSELRRSVNKFDAFISGSDQVWGLSGPYLNDFMFLSFAPKNKRYSYAASFGTDTCPKWYSKKLMRLLNGYRNISVRENTGRMIAKELGLSNISINVDRSAGR